MPDTPEMALNLHEARGFPSIQRNQPGIRHVGSLNLEACILFAHFPPARLCDLGEVTELLWAYFLIGKRNNRWSLRFWPSEMKLCDSCWDPAAVFLPRARQA